MAYFFKGELSFGYHVISRNSTRRLRNSAIDEVEVLFSAHFWVLAKASSLYSRRRATSRYMLQIILIRNKHVFIAHVATQTASTCHRPLWLCYDSIELLVGSVTVEVLVVKVKFIKFIVKFMNRSTFDVRVVVILAVSQGVQLIVQQQEIEEFRGP